MKKNSKVIKCRWSDELIEERRNYKCIHRHNGLTHAKCFETEKGIRERKAVLDIECGGLDAGFDIVYVWALKDLDGNIRYDNLTTEDIKAGIQDKRVIQSLCEYLWDFDRLVLHWGHRRRFDLPFLRTRAIRLGIDNFPKLGEMWVTDTWSMARSLLRLSSNRQGRVASSILGYDEKTAIDHEYWRQMKYGTVKQRKEAIKYIVDHCCHDVTQCEAIYLKMLPYYHEMRSSI